MCKKCEFAQFGNPCTNVSDDLNLTNKTSNNVFNLGRTVLFEPVVNFVIRNGNRSQSIKQICKQEQCLLGFLEKFQDWATPAKRSSTPVLPFAQGAETPFRGSKLSLPHRESRETRPRRDLCARWAPHESVVSGWNTACQRCVSWEPSCC